ncbi:sigma-70 family RNA polymerase sigma factor [Hymenobacter sp. YC55]|uniref:RNA polymerase sigma factor n=1 Tax=Hymenobacter sp. YC55 TaxID=3034019 RepID=UPI0023F6F91C|nr:sigma-70 family RNA polymerase sigma factor [Hymenobacter sp. YC55]MDF7814975.1 sigma-70 family RNA polymerase sigma factor [Hymenobacter sp. YC55]
MSLSAAPSGPEQERVLSRRAYQDLALIQAALAGQAKAYEDLLARYRKPVHYLVLRMVKNATDAEDLTQETFAKAFRHLARFTPEFAFSTWLFRIATNHTLDFFRRKKLPTHSLQASIAGGDSDPLFLEVADRNPDPQQALIRTQRKELMQKLVDQLPARYARVVRLRYFDELQYEEIAVLLALPLGTVKAQLFRARELLLDSLKHSQAAL